jgi:hypothetical protein
MARMPGFPLRAALLLGATALVSAGLVAWQVGRDAAGTADRMLSTLRMTQQLVEAQQDRDLTSRGELIAGNQAVVGYMTQALGSALPGESVDRSSIVDLLDERRSQLGLDVTAAIGQDGALLASTEDFLEGRDFARDPVFTAAAKSQAPRTGLWPEGERLLHVALLPLARYGSGDAYLLVGRWVGQDYAQTIAGIAAGDVAIVAPSPAGPVVASSTLAPEDNAALAAALRGGNLEGARRQLAMSTRKAASESAPLFGNRAVRVVALARNPSWVSTAGAHLPTILFAVAVLLALAAALYWHRRMVALPLQATERLMRRAAETGDRHLHAAEQGSADVARVAVAFNQLMEARDARQD